MNFISELKRRNVIRIDLYNVFRRNFFSRREKMPAGQMRAFKSALDDSPKMGLNF